MGEYNLYTMPIKSLGSDAVIQYDYQLLEYKYSVCVYIGGTCIFYTI